MNIYVVVEGSVSEKKVYSSWIPLINSSYNVIGDIREVSTNSVYIVGGYGYPGYFEIIDNGIKDVNEHEAFNRLVISVDSENMSYEEKRSEIEEYLEGKSIRVEHNLIIQHFCFETWALGNKKIVARNPKSELIRKYIAIHNVLSEDPELLPDLKSENLTRVNFAYKYLKAILNEKHRNLSYSKRNPKVIQHEKYFQQLRDRYNYTDHIKSFGDFLRAF